MAKIRTNFIELLLKELLVGQQIYVSGNTLVTIDDINYQPIIRELYIKSGTDGYKLSRWLQIINGF
jgi:tetrahydromethanopterin S-methyltransferase subunit D